MHAIIAKIQLMEKNFYLNLKKEQEMRFNTTMYSMEYLYNWFDKQTSIGQCVANATEALDVLRCDPDLSSLPTKYDPYSLCYNFNREVRVLDGSMLRMSKQIFSTDLIHKVLRNVNELSQQCNEHRRSCFEIFDGTNETALKAFECLKPHFGNMFLLNGVNSLQNLCLIAYHKFSEARGILEIDLFTRGEAFFDKECFQLQPNSQAKMGYPFEQYMSDQKLYSARFLGGSLGFVAAFLLARSMEKKPKKLRVGALLGSGVLLASLIYSGKWRQNNFEMDQIFIAGSISFIASSFFRSLY